MWQKGRQVSWIVTFLLPTVYVTWFFSMNLCFKYLFYTVKERHCQAFEVSCLSLGLRLCSGELNCKQRHSKGPAVPPCPLGLCQPVLSCVVLCLSIHTLFARDNLLSEGSLYLEPPLLFLSGFWVDKIGVSFSDTLWSFFCLQWCAGKCLLINFGGWRVEVLICSICQFLGCKYSRHGRFQATDGLFSLNILDLSSCVKLRYTAFSSW